MINTSMTHTQQSFITGLIGLFFIVFFCTPASLRAQAQEQQTNLQGKHLYAINCGNCHGLQGKGFLQVYPPLLHSRYLDENIAQLPCIMRHGMKGEIEVNGQRFNQVMPGNSRLSPQDISTIMAFMQAQWQKEPKPIKPNMIETVEQWLHTCKQ